jgi:hypothetical protein
MKSALLLMTGYVMSLSLPCPAAENAFPPFDYPFGNRIIFAETPEMGKKWHGGILTKDLFHWEGYWNVGGWLTVNLMGAGFSDLSVKDKENGGTTVITDNIGMFSLKSRPLVLSLRGDPYKAALGLTLYSTSFGYVNKETGSEYPRVKDGYGGLFLTQSWFINGKHYINLMTSFASRKIESTGSSITAVYIVPSYRCFFGKKRRWSFDFEYYYMNPMELPMKSFQISSSPDKTDFYNPDQEFVSFMFWGFSYSFRHLRLEAHLGNHYSFSGPIIPLVGVGWDF